MSQDVTKRDSIASLLLEYQNGTAEVKHLFESEANVLYECRFCREIFRSIVSFVSHKRINCRGLYDDLAFEFDLSRRQNTAEGRGETSGPSRGRTNLDSVLEERTKQIQINLPNSKKTLKVNTLPRTSRAQKLTEFINGYQQILLEPGEAAIRAQVPDDRVVVVMPTENSSRYGEMQLRNRRGDDRFGTLTTDQFKILQRVPEDLVLLLDLGSMKCQYEDCKLIRPFETYEAMIYHLSICHQATDNIRCFLCDYKTFNTFERLKSHLKDRHASIRKNHLESRKLWMRKVHRKKYREHQHRSISPEGFTRNGDKKEASEAEDESDVEMPQENESPVKLEEEVVEDYQPSSTGMRSTRRGRRRKGGRATLNRRVLSPSKSRQDPFDPDDASLDVDDFLNIQSNDQQLTGSKSTQDETARKRKERRQPSSTPSDEVHDGEDDEDDEPRSKHRKAEVSLIKGRTPRQRALTSRLASDFVVPKKFAAGTASTLLLSESQIATPPNGSTRKPGEKRGRKPKNGSRSTSNTRDPSHYDDDEISDSEPRDPSTTNALMKQLEERLHELDNDIEDGKSIRSGGSSPPPLDSEKTPPSQSTSGSRNVSPMKRAFPSVLTGQDNELLTFSARPKPREGVPPLNDDTRGEAASRRKQNFNTKTEKEDTAAGLKLVQLPGQQPRKPDDLTLMPVTLTSTQRRMFFGPLKPLFSGAREGKDGLHQCAECGTVCKNTAEGHKHMMGHVRIIRIICSLCDVGAFFCTDMRRHLMYRHCEKLRFAPQEMVQEGTPCMDALTADKLIRLADPFEPGRAIYTRGMIISCERPTPYLPDPRIEQRLLGSFRTSVQKSPRKIVLTGRRKSPEESVKPSLRSISQEPIITQRIIKTEVPTFKPRSQGIESLRSERSTSKEVTPPMSGSQHSVVISPTPTTEKEPSPTVDDNDELVIPLTIRANPPASLSTPSPSSNLNDGESEVPKDRSLTPPLPIEDTQSANEESTGKRATPESIAADHNYGATAAAASGGDSNPAVIVTMNSAL